MFKSNVSAFRSSPRLRQQIMEIPRLLLVAVTFSALCRVLSELEGSSCLFTTSYLSTAFKAAGTTSAFTSVVVVVYRPFNEL